MACEDKDGNTRYYAAGDPSPCEEKKEAPKVKKGKALMACVDKNGESHTYEEGDPNPCEEKKAEEGKAAPKKDCAKVQAAAKQCKKDE